MNIAVLLGGGSEERDVSVVTGKAVATALTTLDHDVFLYDPSSRTPYIGRNPDKIDTTISENPPDDSIPDISAAFISLLSGDGLKHIDVVFIALHGGAGENGRIQALLDTAGLPYGGSGMKASAFAMDKILSKRIFAQAGIQTPEWFSVHSAIVSGNRDISGGAQSSIALPGRAGTMEEFHAALDSIGYPYIVKPSCQGSTVGLTLVENEREGPAALKLAARHGEIILVERFIPGREITVSILESEPLPIVEIHPQGSLYDYRCKYSRGGSRYTVPADLSEETASSFSADALAAFQLLGCSSYGRVDFRLENGGERYILEVNTLPGMTATSLVPMAAEAEGIGFSELVERICMTGLNTTADSGIRPLASNS